MAKVDVDAEFVRYLVELMQSIGQVTSKRMFGGSGLFLDGLMFGLVADATLYLKVNKDTESHFIQRDLEPFTYLKKDKKCHLNYYQAPEDALEDCDEMKIWAQQAFEVALSAKAKSKPK